VRNWLFEAKVIDTSNPDEIDVIGLKMADLLTKANPEMLGNALL
jgi:hypothetical protein